MTPGTLLVRVDTGAIVQVISREDYFEAYRNARGYPPRPATAEGLIFFTQVTPQAVRYGVVDWNQYRVVSTFKQQLKELL